MTNLTASRRGFVLGGAAASAAFSLPARSHTPKKYDVIVIGGGLAGLNTAVILADQGLKVKVLEGNSRVGGRVQTGYGLETRPELGASQVGRAYARVISTCQRFNLKLIPEDRDLLTFSSRIGENWIKSEDWETSKFNPLSGDDREIPPIMVGTRLLNRHNPLVELTDWLSPDYKNLDISAYQLFKNNGYSDEAIYLAGLNVLGNDLYSVSCLTMMQEQHRGRWSIENFSSIADVIDAPYGYQEVTNTSENTLSIVSNIADGAEALPKAMAAHLGEGAVEVNKIVMRIDLDDAGAQVQTLDGDIYTADFVVSAVPFTTLRRIDIRPGLPALQNKAVHELPYSNTSRAHLVIKEPFWDNDEYEPSFFSDGAIKMFWAIDNHTGTGQHTGYMVLTGDAASRVDVMPAADASKFLMQELERVRPASKGKVEMVTYKSWENDPFIRGVRHSFAPGQVSEFGNEMIVPHKRMHFAGEHTRRTEIGMEAAMESGERAAIEIIEATS